MTATEITAEFHKALRHPNGTQSLKHFFARIRHLDHDIVSAGLLATFKDRSFTAHDAACAILWCLNIPFTHDLKSSLLKYLKNWDLSTEELPWYLMTACGREQFEQVLDELMESCPPGSILMIQLETLWWWISPEPEVIEEHRQIWLVKLGASDASQ
jgi:hypothetical protein